MEERGNKTIMCSVFFLDIVGYSKKSVAGQISLKERFNSYLSTAIRDVPITDRIILDTGDGAAINFMGDIEDALKAAISLRKHVLEEDPETEHPLLVRMGINLGPVRLVRDINGQPNIVGDGINVAQRVMGFADASQILVSRSYYDAVSRISPNYSGMFHYQGSRTDKHVREHEVYAIGYPGDKSTLGRTSKMFPARSENPLARAWAHTIEFGQLLAARLNTLSAQAMVSFKQAEPVQRLIYIGFVIIPFIFIVVLLVNLAGNREDSSTESNPGNSIANATPSNATAASATAGQVIAGVKEDAPTQSSTAAKLDESKKTKSKPKLKPNPTPNNKHSDGQIKVNQSEIPENKSLYTVAIGGSEAFLAVRCTEGTEVFLDGAKKGRISGSKLTIKSSPGEHTVIASHTSGMESRNVLLEAGKVVHIHPSFCN